MRRARSNKEGYQRLGELLVASGDITDAQLKRALNRTVTAKQSLGEVLTAEGTVCEEQIARALSLLLDYERAAFDTFPIDSAATNAIPEELARKHLVVPLRRLGAELYCAVADPINAAALDEVEAASDCSPQPLVATPREIRLELDRRYGAIDPRSGGPLPLPVGSMFMHYRLAAARWLESAVVFYEADDTRLLRRVLLAIVRPTQDEDVLKRAQRFLEHCLWLARLPHQGILTIHDVGEWEDVRFVVSEALPGETVRERLGREHRFTPQTVCDLALQVCQVFHHLHHYQIVYQTLSPGNCVLTPNGELKLSHLAVRLNPNEHVTHQAMDADEYRYLSPEQLAGEPLDCRSDIFSLGTLLYEMAVGRPAFPGSNVAAVTQMLSEGAVLVAEDLPADLNRILLRACASERHGRFPDVESLADDLRVQALPAGLHARAA